MKCSELNIVRPPQLQLHSLTAKVILTKIPRLRIVKVCTGLPWSYVTLAFQTDVVTQKCLQVEPLPYFLLGLAEQNAETKIY